MRTKLIRITGKVLAAGRWMPITEHTMAQRERFAELLDGLTLDGMEGSLSELTAEQQDNVLDLIDLILPTVFRGWIRDHITMSDVWGLIQAQVRINQQEDLAKKAQPLR